MNKVNLQNINFCKFVRKKILSGVFISVLVRNSY